MNEVTVTVPGQTAYTVCSRVSQILIEEIRDLEALRARVIHDSRVAMRESRAKKSWLWKMFNKPEHKLGDGEILYRTPPLPEEDPTWWWDNADEQFSWLLGSKESLYNEVTAICNSVVDGAELITLLLDRYRTICKVIENDEETPG